MNEVAFGYAVPPNSAQYYAFHLILQSRPHAEQPDEIHILVITNLTAQHQDVARVS